MAELFSDNWQSQGEIKTLANFYANYLKYSLVQNQFNDEDANKTNHASPGVPYFSSPSEPQKWGLKFWNFFRQFHSSRKLCSLNLENQPLLTPGGGSEGWIIVEKVKLVILSLMEWCDGREWEERRRNCRRRSHCLVAGTASNLSHWYLLLLRRRLIYTLPRGALFSGVVGPGSISLCVCVSGPHLYTCITWQPRIVFSPVGVMLLG